MFDKNIKVQIDNKTIVGPQYHLLELDTLTEIKKPRIPQFKIQNPQDADRRIFGLSFTPDAVFSSEGIINIFLNRVRMLPVEDRSQGMLSSVTALNVPIPANLGLKILPRQSLEVFIWNPSGNSAKINFSCFVGDLK